MINDDTGALSTVNSRKKHWWTSALTGISLTTLIILGKLTIDNKGRNILILLYSDYELLKTPPHNFEYIVIIASGLLGTAVAKWCRKPLLNILTVAALSISWVIFHYVILLAGWWLPLILPLIAFILCETLLYPFYLTHAHEKNQLSEIERTINSIYNAIHNGPLQLIAIMLGDSYERKSSSEDLQRDLSALNRELRSIFEILTHRYTQKRESLVVGEEVIELNMPLHNLLYNVYYSTVNRHRSFFQQIINITSFQPMSDKNLTKREKRDLGRFLEESLMNIYRHSKSTTKLTINCFYREGNNVIQITNNGESIKDPTQEEKEGGHGTQQAKGLATQLGGTFQRTKNSPSGTRVELSWPIRKEPWEIFISFLSQFLKRDRPL